jgi:sugar phosphate isomerase/epimerase
VFRRKLLFAPLPLLAQRLTRISVGCQTNAWNVDGADYLSSVQVWSTIRELGYSGVETSFRTLEKHFDRGGEIGSQVRRMGLRLYGVHIWLEEYDAETGLPPRDLIDRIAAGAAKIGAERLILSGHVAPKTEDKLAALKSIELHCRRLGVRLAYHNHAPELTGADPELPRLMKKARDVEFLIDWGYAHKAKADMLTLFQKHRDAIAGMHFRDFRGEQQVPLGQGEVDYAPLAKAMLKANWSGWVLAAEPGESAAGPARTYFRKLLGV